MHKHLILLGISVGLLGVAVKLTPFQSAHLAIAAVVGAGVCVLVFSGLVVRDLIKRRNDPPVSAPRPLPPPLHTISFDYLPTKPIETGDWKRSYGKQEATWERDAEIPGGLKMRQGAGYAMDYRLPLYATPANHIEFTAKYIADAAVYAEVEVLDQDGLHPDTFWFAHLVGKKAPAFLAQYHEWQFWMSPPDHRFLIDLREEVRLSVGRDGLIFAGVKQIKIRGDISISPINLRRLE